MVSRSVFLSPFFLSFLNESLFSEIRWNSSFTSFHHDHNFHFIWTSLSRSSTDVAHVSLLYFLPPLPYLTDETRSWISNFLIVHQQFWTRCCGCSPNRFVVLTFRFRQGSCNIFTGIRNIQKLSLVRDSRSYAVFVCSPLTLFFCSLFELVITSFSKCSLIPSILFLSWLSLKYSCPVRPTFKKYE